MRMRRKKHLDERYQNIADYVIPTDRDIPNVNEAVKDKKYLDFRKIFNNDNPVELEIGCGKGGFICKLAQMYPEKNFIAVELIQNIIVLAGENAKAIGIPNLKFMNIGADYLPRYFRDKSVDAIYLNFSPPFPQKSYECRRLTNTRLVQNYREMLKDGASIYQKTDDEGFFNYSYNQFENNGFSMQNLSGENHNIPAPLAVLTEYEEKFIKQGLTIFRHVATKK